MHKFTREQILNIFISIDHTITDAFYGETVSLYCHIELLEKLKQKNLIRDFIYDDSLNEYLVYPNTSMEPNR